MTSRQAATVERRLAFHPPFAADRLLGFLASRAIPGVEHVAGGRYSRAMRTSAGGHALVQLSTHPSEPVVELVVTGDQLDEASLAELERRARRLFDLDADPSSIDAGLGADPLLAPSVVAAPGTRLPGAVDGFEMAVRAIVGQQVSVAGARTTLGRISARFGVRVDATEGDVTHAFPTPERMAEAPNDGLGMPRSRADAIVSVAASVAAGDLDLSGAADPTGTIDSLRSIRGVGEWTAAYVSMRALGDTDAFLVGDLGVRRRFAALGLPDDPASMRRRAERWRPWRAYGVIHLWTGPSSSRDGSRGGRGNPAA